MTAQEDPRIESLRRLLEQHWLQCRHLEWERAGFAGMYTAIVGGMLAYLFTSGTMQLWLLCFLIAITVVGCLLTIRWTYAFEHHREWIKKTASELGIYVAVDIPDTGIWKVVRTRYLFPFFYVLGFAGLVFLAITN